MASKTQTLPETGSALPFTHKGEFIRDDKYGYTVYDNCKLDKSRIVLDLHWTPDKQYGTRDGTDHSAQSLSEFPDTYEQISYIDDQDTFYLESYEGVQYGEMQRSTNGMFIAKVIKFITSFDNFQHPRQV